MHDDESLPKVTKKLERYIMTLPAAKQFNTLGTEAGKSMMALGDSAYNLRINTERYFFADDSVEQKKFLESAIEYAEAVQDNIMAASQFDLLGPADVAHLSALAETIRERLA